MEGYKDNSGFNAVFGSGGSGGSSATDYTGSFFSSTTQIAVGSLTQNIVEIENVQISNGITIGGTTFSEITYANNGIYALNFSLQVQNTGTLSQENLFVYLLWNGTKLPNSTRNFEMQSIDDVMVCSLDYLLNLSGGDIIEIGWVVTNIALELTFTSAPLGAVFTDIPSVICNSFKVQ